MSDYTDLKDRGRGSWKKDSPPVLRRLFSTEPATARELKAPAPPAVSSSLSAEAKEWYPPNYSSAPQQPSVQSTAAPVYNGGSPSIPRYSAQNRLKIHNHNQNQESFQNANQFNYANGGPDSNQFGVTNLQSQPNYNGMPYQQRSSVQERLRAYQAPGDSFQAGDSGQNNYAVDLETDDLLMESLGHLITVMCEVTFSPGSFDGLCGPLVDSFASTLNDLDYTQPLVEAIVNQSVSEPNFRYNGARLCSMYDSVEGESVFRSCLFERCAAHEARIMDGQETSENMRGFAMFLAELYTQLENPEGGRIPSLGGRLCKILQYFLNGRDPACVKSVCQILKLSGLALDADCPNEVDQMFIQLHRIAEEKNIENGSLRFLVRNVLNLRHSRWLSSDPHKNIEIISNGSATANTGSYRDPIYMPDGLKLTAEESAFLQNNIDQSNEDDEAQEESSEDVWDTDMDPEMAAGFLEFLKMSNQIKR